MARARGDVDKDGKSDDSHKEGEVMRGTPWEERSRWMCGGELQWTSLRGHQDWREDLQGDAGFPMQKKILVTIIDG